MPKAAKAPSAFDLRSTSVTLLLLVLRTASVDALRAEVQSRYGAAPGTFDDDLTVLDLSHIDAAAQIDFAAFVGVLRNVNLLPAGVRGGSAEQMAAALAVGLGDAGDVGDALPAMAGSVTSVAPDAAGPVVDVPAPAVESPTGTGAPASDGVVARPVSAPAEPAPGLATMVIDKPLRSGQQVYARGGDLVVLAAVNFGAEVIADGNVHVYGPLRGKAIAGARGDTAARIFSTSMRPELLSIAGTYRTSENPLSADVDGRAAQVRLDGDRLVFEPLG